MPVALVTGGAQRLGRTIGLALAKAGYDIAVHFGHSGAEALKTCRELRDLGVRAEAFEADLSDEVAVRALPAAVARALDPVTVLVNCASVFQDDRFGALDRERWDRHFATNLRAPIVLAETITAALPASVPDGEASIVNILDQRVLKPNPQFFSYGLSKAALFAATRMTAQALAPRIRVNAVAPGPTFGSIHQQDDEFSREAAAVPLENGSPPEDVAAGVVYLARARAVTGQTIAVDGGQHIAWKTPDILTY